MGRKNENRISRNTENKEGKENKDDCDELEIEEDNSFYQDIEEERQFNIIANVLNDIMTYVDDNSLPLCDYLNHKSIENFVECLINR
jgi:hypothetical protein